MTSFSDAGAVEMVVDGHYAQIDRADPGVEPSPDGRRDLIVAALRAEPTWSDRRIALACGVSPKLVARTRSGAAVAQPVQAGTEKRVGRDGRARPVRAGAMRASILKMLDEQPNASLRTVAAALGVSPETVRTVRRTREAGVGVVETRWEGARSSLDDLVLLRFRREAPAPWRGDTAFSSTTTGEAFVDWFESTNIGDERCRADEVPLSRIYEIADEARRRAAFWTEFADLVERRARRR